MLDIDGSVLEGGGQILRIALGLSTLLKLPIRVYKIRAGRQKPGLAAQHLKGVELLQSMCNAKVKGAVIGSTEIKFDPGVIKSGKFFADPRTAGSIGLLLQVSLPVALFGPGTTILDLKGGTNAAMAPQIDFITEIFRSNLEKFGATFDFELFKRGYFGTGGGHCKIIINPVDKISACSIVDFGRVTKFFGWSFVAGVLPVKIAYDMTDGAKDVLKRIPGHEAIEIESYKESSEVASGNCSGLILGCETTSGVILGSSALGNYKEKPSNTGQQVAKELDEYIRKTACVDAYVQDQLIIYMALADGISKIKTVKPTLHTKTAIHVVELMTKARFNIIEGPNDTCVIECKGIGLVNPSSNWKN